MPDLRFEFIANTNEHTLTIRREFAAKRQLVWDCHTKREYLDQWFAPQPLTTKTKTMDFREGGHWHYAMIMPNGEKFWNRLDYLSIKPIDGYSALDGFCDESGVINPGQPRSNWNVAFSDSGILTLVTTIVRYGSAEDLQTSINMGLEGGLKSTMERLDQLLPKLAG